MYIINYMILWKKMLDVFQPSDVLAYNHQDLTKVVREWVQAK
jgi:hypothetical protein